MIGDAAIHGTSPDPVPVLLVPGLGGSGADHWQAVWAATLSNAHLVKQRSWDQPDPQSWIAALSDAVDELPGAIVVAHSLGCMVVAHLVNGRPSAPISGALLVCPPDVESEKHTPSEVRCFEPIPLPRFPFPAIVVGSESDPFVTVARARGFADRWGAQFINVGRCGHINTVSGHGPWPEGLSLLRELKAEVRDGHRRCG